MSIVKNTIWQRWSVPSNEVFWRLGDELSDWQRWKQQGQQGDWCTATRGFANIHICNSATDVYHCMIHCMGEWCWQLVFATLCMYMFIYIYMCIYMYIYILLDVPNFLHYLAYNRINYGCSSSSANPKPLSNWKANWELSAHLFQSQMQTWQSKRTEVWISSDTGILPPKIVV